MAKKKVKKTEAELSLEFHEHERVEYLKRTQPSVTEVETVEPVETDETEETEDNEETVETTETTQGE